MIETSAIEGSQYSLEFYNPGNGWPTVEIPWWIPALAILTLPQINMEADRGPCLEDSSLIKGPSPLPC